MKKILGVSIIILGVLSGIQFFRASAKLNSEGTELKGLRSVGGTSVAESYYQSMGEYGIAYATLSNAFGLGIIAISLGLGGRMLLEKEDINREETVNISPNENVLSLFSEEMKKPSLFPCPNCNNPCSTQAEFCPKCKTKIEIS